MSLQVWLPLTGDLHNQGLSDVTITNSDITVNNNGKIGRCIQTGNSAIDLRYDGAAINTESMSIGGWFKFNQSEIATRLQSATINETRHSPIGNIIGNNSYGGIGLIWEANNMYQDGTLNELHVFGNMRSSTLGYRSTGTYTISFDQWTHIFLIFDKSSNTESLYVNGVRVSQITSLASFSDASTRNMQINAALVCGGNGPGVNIPFYCNDVRIYNHALTEREVKEIAHGLVLHYPLNNNGLGNENLMPNSIDTLVGSSNYNTGTWRLAGSSQMNRSRVAIPDSPIGTSVYGFQSVGKQTGVDASCWGIDSFPRESGVTYTVSAWGRIVGGSTTAAMLGFSLYSATSVSYGGEYGEAKSSDTEYYGSGAYDYAGGRLRPDGKWTRIWRTFTSTASSGNIYIGFNTATTGDDVTLQLCGVKMEKGTTATTWCPKSSDTLYTKMGMNNNIVYDISGFNNNGTVTGALSTSSDTARYKVGTVFHGSPDHIKTINTNYISQGAKQLTASIWAKTTDIISNNRLFSCIETGGFGIATGSSGSSSGLHPIIHVYTNEAHTSTAYKYDYDGVAKSTISNNEWHMFTMVYDQLQGTKLYIDGELKNTYNITSYGIHFNPAALLFLGCECSQTAPTSPYFNGSLSDFRLYYTALSASDIAELYEMGREVV